MYNLQIHGKSVIGKTIDLSKSLPKLFNERQSLDAVVYIEKRNGLDVFAAIQGIKTAKFSYNPNNEDNAFKFNLIDTKLDFLDSDVSSFYSVSKKQGLKVRQN